MHHLPRLDNCSLICGRIRRRAAGRTNLKFRCPEQLERSVRADPGHRVGLAVARRRLHHRRRRAVCRVHVDCVRADHCDGDRDHDVVRVRAAAVPVRRPGRPGLCSFADCIATAVVIAEERRC